MQKQITLIAIIICFLLTPVVLARDTRRKSSDNITIQYYKKQERFANRTINIVRDCLAQLNSKLGPVPEFPLEVVITRSRKEFEQYLHGGTKHWALAFATPPHYSEGKRQRNGVIVIDPTSLDIRFNLLFSTVKHEVCHIFLGEIQGQSGRTIPRWFDEGLAQWVSGRLVFDNEEYLRIAGVTKRLIPLARLEDSFPSDRSGARLAYLESESVINFIAREYGPGSIKNIIVLLRQGVEFESAFSQTLHISPAELERVWQRQFRPGLVNLLIITLSRRNIFILIGVLALIAFFLYRVRRRRRLKEMEEEEAWMQSLDQSEWDES